MFGRTYYNPTERIWSGPKKTPLFHQDASVGHVLECFMQQHYPKVAQIFAPTGESWTYERLHKTSMAIAKSLVERNISQDDIIGISASNTPYVAPLVIAAFLSGIPFSPLYPAYDKEGVKHSINLTRPKILFCDKAFHDVIVGVIIELGLECPVYVLDEDYGAGTIGEFVKGYEEAIFEAVPLKKGGDQLAAILYSSGSTGLPKGVRISNQQLLNTKFMELKSEDIMLTFSSLYWMTGVVTLFQVAYFGATRILTNESFKPETLFKLIEKFKVTTMLTPPSQMALMLKSPAISTSNLSSLREYYCGGAMLHFPVIQAIQKYFKNGSIIAMYGMTEIFGTCVACIPKAPGNIGFLRTNFEVRIVDDNGQNMGPNEVGEIVIKSNYNWAGYHENPKATDEIYKDGWMFSGDLGYFNDEGSLFILDRKKDVLYFSQTEPETQILEICPSKIEQVITEISDVAEVCVFGIPDEVHTNCPAAAVVKLSGCDLNEQFLLDYVAERLPDHNKLRGGVFFVDSMPKTVSGKTIRRVMKEICVKTRL